MHHGIDLAVPKGTTLAATVDGTVVFAGMGTKGSGYNNYGNVVAIRDSQGRVHVFAHLDSVGLKVGQQISRGTDIGRSGNTGISTGPHLHYEVRINGQLGNTVDPRQFLR